MNTLHRAFRLVLPLLFAQATFAQDVDVVPLGNAVERHLSIDEPFMHWVQDPGRFNFEASDKIELRETLADELETIKLTNVVPPIYFESGVAKIPDTTVASLGEILHRMRDRMNVRLHMVGHADNQPLSPRLQAIYVDNMGLSKERAGEVAEHMQTALSLPPEAVSYAWEGDTKARTGASRSRSGTTRSVSSRSSRRCSSSTTSRRSRSVAWRRSASCATSKVMRIVRACRT